MIGYIKLYRKMLENPIICKDSDYLSVWIYLLLEATHRDVDVIFNNERIMLKAGQLITGRRAIADKFSINENKVQRILKTFENAQQIEQQTTTQNRLITIVRWNDYQSERQQFEQQMNNERTTTEQRVNTNNNIKNDNNIYLYLYNKHEKNFSLEKTLDEKQRIFRDEIMTEKEYKQLSDTEQMQLYSSLINKI